MPRDSDTSCICWMTHSQDFIVSPCFCLQDPILLAGSDIYPAFEGLEK